MDVFNLIWFFLFMENMKVYSFLIIIQYTTGGNARAVVFWGGPPAHVYHSNFHSQHAPAAANAANAIGKLVRSLVATPSTSNGKAPEKPCLAHVFMMGGVQHNVCRRPCQALCANGEHVVLSGAPHTFGGGVGG